MLELVPALDEVLVRFVTVLLEDQPRIHLEAWPERLELEGLSNGQSICQFLVYLPDGDLSAIRVQCHDLDLHCLSPCCIAGLAKTRIISSRAPPPPFEPSYGPGPTDILTT